MNERKWCEIVAQSGAVAEVWIYEEIGTDFWGEGLTAKQFVTDLAALEVDHIALHINSPGGSVFDGQAIYNALERHPATVTSYIDGVAASIASVIALAGDHVEMAENALFMIHDPHGFAMGTAAEMRQMAGILDKVGDTILGVYERKTDINREKIAADMAAETWFTAAEAVAAGYVDSVAAPVKALARFDFHALGYRNAPEIPTTEDTAADALEAPSAPALEARRDRHPVCSPGYSRSLTNRRE